MSPFPSINAIYTDGACSGNPGPGGWGSRVEFSNGQVHELGAHEPGTTNNRMEMQAAIAALEYLRQWQSQSGQSGMVTLHTDSQYVIKGITQWIRGWKRKGWKNAQGKPVLNQDLWEKLDQLNGLDVQWQYVRGHAGNVGNERCDAIARGFSLRRSPSLQTYVLEAASLPKPLNSDEKTAILPDEAEISTFETLGLDNALAIGENDMMTDEISLNAAGSELSRSARVMQIRDLVETLRVADEVADKGYLISSSELAALMDVNASAVTSRGAQWVWRNWVVSRVRREGNQILWQLERVD
jgi:ribonuclease HI